MQWTQPDTIVPGTGNPQAFDRFAYGLNNPIRYNDPSGHCATGAAVDTVFCIFVAAMVIGGVADASINAYNQYQNTGHVDAGEVFTHAWEGALIGGGVVIGAAAVVSAAPALLTAAGLTKAGETAKTQNTIENISNELKTAEKTIQNAVPVAKQTLDSLIKTSERVSITNKEAVYRNAQNASGALNEFGNSINTRIVSANANLTRFWAKSPLGGRVDFRLFSSATKKYPSTPVLQFSRIPGYIKNIRFHFFGR
jgi:hypothetical protein